MDEEKILKAGKIASQAKDYIKPLIKPGMPLLEIAEKIESKITELGGKPAFPVNLSINNIAAHYTPSYDDETKAYGLLKIDFGVHIDGWIADTAFSLDLSDNEEESQQNKKLISTSEKALGNALEMIKSKSDKMEERRLSQIGKIIQETIESFGFSSIINLSGHSMEQYDLHAGITIPNIDDKRNIPLKPGIYAIEPFATTGNGKVHDGKKSGIYMLTNTRNIRSLTARKILEFIEKEYNTLPFCSRWIFKKFGINALLGLKQLEDNGNLHHFSQLVESQTGRVAQTEHTILVKEDKIIVTTE